MAYYFAVETKKDNFNAISIKRCREYSHKAFMYDNSFACTLEEINKITTTFKNEEELKQALVKSYSLPVEHIEKPLVIFYKEGMDSRLVKGNILYENSSYLIEDVSETIRYIENKSKENDYQFFRQLSTILSNESITKSLVSKIASLIEKSILTGIREKELEEINGLGTNIVIETAKLLIYNNCVNEQGIIGHTKRVNYENLHNLVSFISNYETTLNRDKTSGLKRIKTKENTSN